MQKSPFFALESGFRPFLFAVEFEYSCLFWGRKIKFYRSILPALQSGKAISDGVEKKTEIVLLALCPFCFLFDEEEKKSQGGFQYTLFFLSVSKQRR